MIGCVSPQLGCSSRDLLCPKHHIISDERRLGTYFISTFYSPPWIDLKVHTKSIFDHITEQAKICFSIVPRFARHEGHIQVSHVVVNLGKLVLAWYRKTLLMIILLIMFTIFKIHELYQSLRRYSSWQAQSLALWWRGHKPLSMDFGGGLKFQVKGIGESGKLGKKVWLSYKVSPMTTHGVFL